MKLPVRQYWSLVAVYLAPQRGRMLLLAVALFGAIGAQLLAPQVLRIFIDAAIGDGTVQTLLVAATIFLGLALLTQTLGVAATYLGETVGWQATNALRLDLTRHCLTLDLAFHNTTTPGELMERVDGDVTTLARFFSRFIIEVLGNLLLVLGVVAMLTWEDWRLGLGTAGFVLLSLAVLTFLRTIAIPHVAAWREQTAQIYGFLGEQLAGTEDLRANGASDYVLRQFMLRLRLWLAVYHRARFGGTTLWAATVGLLAIGNAIALGISAYLWSRDAITIGAIFSVFYYIRQLTGPIIRLRDEVEELQRSEAGIQRIAALWAVQPTLPPGGDTPLPSGPLDVEVAGLHFAYKTDEPILQDVGFRLPVGQVLGLLGRTGSGKSTLARLLLGLYAPQAGWITLGGVELNDTPRRDLPRHVGMVTQEVHIFQGTVRENLTFFDAQITDANLYEAITLLGLDGWLARLPDGLDTQIGANGVGLSAGEAQLLAFARVFLKDPGLVILDEASARLDPGTEALLTQAMERLFTNRSAIVIAHRLQTVLRADQILILENGQVVEYGNRTVLEANPDSRFSKLLRVGMMEVTQ